MNRAQVTQIGRVAKLLRGVTYKKEDSRTEPAPGLLPILRATNIGSSLTFDGLVYVPEKVVNEEQLLQPGDSVIAASSGSSSVVGKAAVLRDRWRGSFGAFCFGLRPDPSLVAPFFMGYFLQSSEYRNGVSRLAAGVNINNLKREHVESMEMPMFSLQEQNRIVAAIESYFSRLDAATATLERVQRNLERYRVSVLKAAVEGRLVPTEAELAKKEGRSYEPASALLQRILLERRRRSEEVEFAKLKARGKAPTGDRWKERYEEPAAPSLDGLPELPEGWCWTTVECVGDVLLGRQRAPQYLTGRFSKPYLRVANIKDDHIDFGDVEEMDFHPEHFEKYRLQAGDILVSEGQSPELLGQCAIFRGEREGLCFQKTLHRFRPVRSGPSSEFAQLVFRSHVRNGVFMRLGSITTNIAHLTLEKFKSAPFPLAPRDEQVRIEEAAARQLSTIDVIDHEVAQQLGRIARVRQCILKWAFEGRLVDHDAVDSHDAAPREGASLRSTAARVTDSLGSSPPARVQQGR